MKISKSRLYLFVGFLCLILIVLGIWLWNRNTYSKEALKLEILAPSTVQAGQDIEYIVKFKNNGDIRLDNPSLVFEFPAFSVPADGGLLRKTIAKEELGGAIYPGAEKIFKFKGKLFGQAGDSKETKALLSYQPKNLTAKYVSETNHLSTISNVPLTFDFDLASEIETGKPIDFTLNYFSSFSSTLDDITIKVNYPSDFVFTSSQPKGLSSNEWHLNSLNKAQGGKIKISGTLNGQTGESKTFSADFGIWISGQKVILKDISKDVSVVEPSIYLDQTINGVQDYAANQGDALHYQIIFRNIGDRTLQSLFLVARLKSDLLDFSTLKTTDGQFTLGDNSIMWDGRKVSSLQFLDPGEEGQVEFWINLSADKISSSKDPQIESEIRLGQTKKVFYTKINSKLELVQELYVDDELFGSEGPLPLKVNQESILTAFWRLKNYYSLLKDVKIKATLPSNVELTGQIAPQEISFDSQTRELIWNVSELAEGAGLLAPKLAGFQIKIKPNTIQKGKAVVVLTNISVSAQDQTTGSAINLTFPDMETSLLGQNGTVQ